MLEVSEVSKQYPTPHGPLGVLSKVSFSMAPGESAAITGPSGSGKSTLLHILGGLETPSAGSVRLNGQTLSSLNARQLAEFRNAQVGFVFQDHCLLPQCSVLENVLVPTLVSPSHHGADFNRWVLTLIEEVGLADRLDHRPAELSGGEKQRVAVARALVQRPGLVLCDEPTGNLDHASADLVSSLLMDLHQQQENILIVVTHSDRLASRFPTRFELTGQQLNRVA